MTPGAVVAVVCWGVLVLLVALALARDWLENRELRKLKRLERKRERWREDLAALREERWLS
jgi:hypothetical protein